MTPEGKVKAMVKRRMAAEFPGCYHFMPVQNGMGAPGLDFFYCIEGLFVAIETKAPGGKLTERQKVTAAVITQAGGLVFKVASAEDLEHVIDILRHESPVEQRYG